MWCSHILLKVWCEILMYMLYFLNREWSSILTNMIFRLWDLRVTLVSSMTTLFLDATFWYVCIYRTSPWYWPWAFQPYVWAWVPAKGHERLWVVCFTFLQKINAMVLLDVILEWSLNFFLLWLSEYSCLQQSSFLYASSFMQVSWVNVCKDDWPYCGHA